MSWEVQLNSGRPGIVLYSEFAYVNAFSKFSISADGGFSFLDKIKKGCVVGGKGEVWYLV